MGILKKDDNIYLTFLSFKLCKYIQLNAYVL